MATGTTDNYLLPYPLSTDPVRIAGDIEELATKIDTILNEEIQDASALMWTGGSFSNGIQTPTYNDSTGKMSMTLAQDIRSSASPEFVNLTLTGDAEIRGGDLTTSQTTFNVFNTTATTINIGGSATTINIGNSAGKSNFAGDINIGSTKSYQINNSSVLTSTSLGSSVVSSSLTSVGTITSGTWSASFGAVSGANLTNLTADNLEGTIPAEVLGTSSVFIGTTEIALDRESLAMALTGILSIDGSAETLTTGRTIAMTGDVVWTSPSFDGSKNITATSTISNNAVTYSKIQNVSAQYRVLGRITAAAGIVEELTPDNMVTLISQASTITGTGSVVLSNSPTLTGTVVLPSNTSIGDVSNTEISYLDGVTSSIQTQINSKENKNVSINSQTESYTIVLSDASKIILIDSSSANTLNIPADATLDFPVGTRMEIVQAGTGQTIISPESGVTVNSFGESLALPGQWSSARIIKVSADQWLLLTN